MDRNHTSANAAPRRAVVIGGGLAGLSAACHLADMGIAVTLLERRPYLGGKVYSISDPHFGDIDNGQHVFLRCCTYYIDFLKKLGVLGRTHIQCRLSIPVIGLDGARSDLGRTDGKPPFHLGRALARYRHLSAGEKVAALYATLAMRRITPGQRVGLDGMTFYAWLKDHGQSDRSIDCLWDIIVVPTLNADSRRVSAAQAIMVFQEAFLKKSDAADVGLSTVGLSHLCYKEARAYIESRGGRVLTGQHIRHLEGERKGIAAVRTFSGESFTSDLVVAAVPQRDLLAMLPPSVGALPFFYRATNLKVSPIVNLHLWLDREITDLPFAAYLGSRIQWVFAKPSWPGQGQHIVISVSGGHEHLNTPKAILRDLLVDDLKKRIPGAQNAKVLHDVMVWEPQATFSPEPDSATWRLPSKTPVPNLFLAGAWTDTGWPATMEGAVRSGVFAAREVATLIEVAGLRP